MNAVLWVAVMVVVSVLWAEANRRVPPKLGVALFLAIPLLGTPVWLTLAGAPLFSVVKVYSVCAGMVLLHALKATRWADHPWGRRAAYLLLALNILEAVAADAKETSALNAVTGVLLVLTQAHPAAVRVKDRDFHYDLGGGWVAAYALWNLAFVYGNRPGFAAFAIVHLAAPLIAARGRASLWLQARVSILTLMMIVRMSAPWPPWLVLVPEWQSPGVQSALYAVAFAAALIVAARDLTCALVGRARRGKSGP